ncbi:MAG: hypothetical protein AAB897_00190 [Patescibacteria group bacterium]
MPLRQNKRNNRAHELSKRLRRRFYKGAAVATLAYVTLSLVSFHGELENLPFILAVIWAVFILCYTTFKEVLRWSDAGEEEIYHGEFWASLVIAGAAWMIAWNIGRAWFFHLAPLHFPEDYQAAAVETIALYTLSTISSFLYKYQKLRNLDARERSRARLLRLRHGKIMEAQTATALAAKAPPQDQKMEIGLAKAPMREENELPPP